MPSGGLYATYHLLGEPETTIDIWEKKDLKHFRLRLRNHPPPTNHQPTAEEEMLNFFGVPSPKSPKNSPLEPENCPTPPFGKEKNIYMGVEPKIGGFFPQNGFRENNAKPLWTNGSIWGFSPILGGPPIYKPSICCSFQPLVCWGGLVPKTLGGFNSRVSTRVV